VLVVAATVDVKPGVIRKATFSRPPSPNPTRGDVAFAVVLPRATAVRISVHDVLGRTVATLEDGPLSAGEHPYRWNGRAADGRVAGSGRYFVRLSAGSTLETRAISLVR